MKTLIHAAVFAALFVPVQAQNGGNSARIGHAVPRQMVVTEEAFPGNEIPLIEQADVKVLQDGNVLPVTEWIALKGDKAGLELYILIDEKDGPAEAAQFDQLRQFVISQPAATAVGIAYMNDGEANIVQKPTTDHARAAKALRLPTGNNSQMANPFLSLSALINGWQAGPVRREVLMVTDGVDVFHDVNSNSFTGFAIADAQRAGIVVFSLYTPGAGHAGHSPELIRAGQADMAHVAEQTGGEAYFRPGQASPSFEPYLADIERHLEHQYQVTFLAVPVLGEPFQRVVFTTRQPDVEVIAAHRFYLNVEQPALP